MNPDATTNMSTDTLFGLSPGTLQKIRHTLAQHACVQRAVVYGSRAKGTHKPGSDIDLTLYAAPGATIDHRELGDIEEEIDDLLLPYMVDLSVFDFIDNAALREHIERVGQMLYARG
jgi:predicted nucleotidyltransferase